MAKYKTETSKETIQEADKLAKANQRPGQTKEQTKLIALGIQKGIEQYKKKQKSKSRELDKKLKTIKNQAEQLSTQPATQVNETNKKHPVSSTTSIAWFLLFASWVGFIAYIYTLST